LEAGDIADSKQLLRIRAAAAPPSGTERSTSSRPSDVRPCQRPRTWVASKERGLTTRSVIRPQTCNSSVAGSLFDPANPGCQLIRIHAHAPVDAPPSCPPGRAHCPPIATNAGTNRPAPHRVRDSSGHEVTTAAALGMRFMRGDDRRDIPSFFVDGSYGDLPVSVTSRPVGGRSVEGSPSPGIPAASSLRGRERCPSHAGQRTDLDARMRR